MLFQDYFSDNFELIFKLFKQKNHATYESKYHNNYLSLKGFEQDLKSRKMNLISAIKSKTFRFSPLYPVVIYDKKKPEKKPRLICIPTIQDRLVQMILIKYLGEHHKHDLAMFKSTDFSVEGVGIIQARQKAKDLRSSKDFVLKTDISSFFDNLDRNQLINDFRETLPIDIFYLFESIVKCDPIIPSDYSKNRKELIHSKLGKGVRQGMPLSPLIASFYLSEFDEWLKRKKYKHVRYADDLIFFLDSEQQCNFVFLEIEKQLKNIQLSLPKIEETSKTQIIAPYQSVIFLGLDLSYVNQQYNWYIPSHIATNVEDSLMVLTSISKNIQKNLNFSKTINRMEQIVLGYAHCYKDAESKNLKDFRNKLYETQSKAIDILFKNLGIDISKLQPAHKNYLIGTSKLLS
ncbi:reverse transcriptase [Acinetobacter radioresistens]|uniref:reverse transcriptase domain-containing protein n=1 Tax=Acinetobacter radioresistens TaxID=40216 RepID=UPI002005CCA4|nr:reverse transcriptase domain-containing protein [Acinetobacter radioresistens]MCK4090641.1 reverse transcriptase [Acinetobacter radioresistens]